MVSTVYREYLEKVADGPKSPESGSESPGLISRLGNRFQRWARGTVKSNTAPHGKPKRPAPRAAQPQPRDAKKQLKGKRWGNNTKSAFDVAREDIGMALRGGARPAPRAAQPQPRDAKKQLKGKRWGNNTKSAFEVAREDIGNQFQNWARGTVKSKNAPLAKTERQSRAPKVALMPSARTAPARTAPARTAPARTAPARTAPARTAPARTAPAPARRSRPSSLLSGLLPKRDLAAGGRGSLANAVGRIAGPTKKPGRPSAPTPARRSRPSNPLSGIVSNSELRAGGRGSLADAVGRIAGPIKKPGRLSRNPYGEGPTGGMSTGLQATPAPSFAKQPSLGMSAKPKVKKAPTQTAKPKVKKAPAAS